MNNFQTYNVSFIKNLLKENPTKYSKMIAKDSNLLSWLSCYVGFTTTSIPEMVYAVVNPKESRTCNSGRVRRFRNINIGWLGCGDRSCTDCKEKSQTKAKITSMKTWGVENPMQCDQVKQKLRNTNIEKYGVEWPASTEEVKNQRRETCRRKYGADHNWKTAEGQQQRKKTMMEKYGVENPSQNAMLQKKKIATSKEKYCTDYPMQSEIIKQKQIQTMLEKYGVSNISSLPEIRKKASDTMMAKYGVPHASQNPYFVEKQQATMLDRYGVVSASQIPAITHAALEKKRQNFFNSLQERTNHKVSPLFVCADYSGVAKDYSWKCNTCDNNFFDTLDDGWIPRCPKCFPVSKSQGEDQLYQFICSLVDQTDVIRNTRSVISPRELDIYIPKAHLAIEFHGLYRHSEVSGMKDRHYHLTKYQEAQNQGVRLIQIWDLEWETQRDIVESRIKQALKLSNKIPARKCSVILLDTEIKRDFLNSNHIQGDCNTKINLGLIYQDTVVAVMSFSQARFTKAQWELVRYCSLKNHTVVGGASKLMRFFERANPSSSIVSYCDLRWGQGGLYRALGFTLSHVSQPNYWYRNKQSSKLFSRIKFQHHKLHNQLDKFDPTLTEWQNMQNNGYDRVWDCGNLVFLRQL